MFGKNKPQFKTEAELQRYIDKKIMSTTHSDIAASQRKWERFSEEQNRELNRLREKVVHLEKFLGVEFGTETTTGYKKVKKTKKK